MDNGDPIVLIQLSSVRERERRGVGVTSVGVYDLNIDYLNLCSSKDPYLTFHAYVSDSPTTESKWGVY